MLTDHTGYPLKCGQKATMDSEHGSTKDWDGEVIELGGTLCFKYRLDGDVVEITPELAMYLEVLR